MRLLILLLTNLLTFAQNEFFITVEPFRDWKPKLEFERKTPYGKLKFEYKLFGEKKLKYKLFNLFDIDLSKETLTNPERIKGIREYRKTVELLIKNRWEASPKKAKRNGVILCKGLKKTQFCRFKIEKNLIRFPLNSALDSFTLFVDYLYKTKRCKWISIKTFADLELLVVYSAGWNVKVNFAGFQRFLKTDKRDYLIVEKVGKRVYIETSKSKVFLLTELSKVYLSDLILYKGCQSVYNLYFYPRNLTLEELQILKDNFKSEQ